MRHGRAAHPADFAREFARLPARFAGTFAAKIRWPRHSAMATHNLAGFLQPEQCHKSAKFLRPIRCQKSRRFLKPDRCQKTRRFLQPDRCQKSRRFLKPNRCQKFRRKFAGFRSLSHMKFGKPRKEFNEKLRGQLCILPWNFWENFQGL